MKVLLSQLWVSSEYSHVKDQNVTAGIATSQKDILQNYP